MSNTRCEAVHWMTPIFVISLVISFVVPILERPLIYLLCIVTTLAHWHYGTKVVSWTIHFLSSAFHSQLTNELFFFYRFMQVQQMCVHFNRQCFKVTPPTSTKSDWMHFIWNSDQFSFAACILLIFWPSLIVGRPNEPMKIFIFTLISSMKYVGHYIICQMLYFRRISVYHKH